MLNLSVQHLEKHSNTEQQHYRSWHQVNRQEELPTRGEGGGGRRESQSIVTTGDGGQASLSLKPDADDMGPGSLLKPDAHFPPLKYGNLKIHSSGPVVYVFTCTP